MIVFAKTTQTLINKPKVKIKIYDYKLCKNHKMPYLTVDGFMRLQIGATQTQINQLFSSEAPKSWKLVLTTFELYRACKLGFFIHRCFFRVGTMSTDLVNFLSKKYSLVKKFSEILFQIYSTIQNFADQIFQQTTIDCRQNVAHNVPIYISNLSNLFCWMSRGKTVLTLSFANVNFKQLREQLKLKKFPEKSLIRSSSLWWRQRNQSPHFDMILPEYIVNDVAN